MRQGNVSVDSCESGAWNSCLGLPIAFHGQLRTVPNAVVHKVAGNAPVGHVDDLLLAPLAHHVATLLQDLHKVRLPQVFYCVWCHGWVCHPALPTTRPRVQPLHMPCSYHTPLPSPPTHITACHKWPATQSGGLGQSGLRSLQALVGRLEQLLLVLLGLLRPQEQLVAFLCLGSLPGMCC